MFSSIENQCAYSVLLSVIINLLMLIILFSKYLIVEYVGSVDNIFFEK